MLLVLLALKSSGVPSESVPRQHVLRARMHAAFACVHRPRAGLFIGEHACIGLVLTCSSANMHASASCWLVYRRTCVHRARAGLFVGEHACIGLVLACSSANMRASGSCWLVRRRTCVHGLVLACSSASTRAPVSCWLVHRQARVHRRVPVFRKF